MFYFVEGRQLRDLSPVATLADRMFVDRARQFHDRLGWDVTVDPVSAHETDEYDCDDTLYVIVRDSAGGHAGSMRLRSTCQPTMINDHFRHLLPGGRAIQSSRIWESTRFCLAPGGRGARRTAARLMYAAARFVRAHGVDALVAVFDARMIPIYRRIGWPPEVLGDDGGRGRHRCSAGIWHFDPRHMGDAARAAQLLPGEIEALEQSVATAPSPAIVSENRP